MRQERFTITERPREDGGELSPDQHEALRVARLRPVTSPVERNEAVWTRGDPGSDPKVPRFRDTSYYVPDGLTKAEAIELARSIAPGFDIR